MSGLVQGLVWRAEFPPISQVYPDPAVARKRAVGIPVVKAVLARLADACNDDGEGRWAVGKGRLASDIGNVAEATVKRAIAYLRTLRILTYQEGETGGRGVAAKFDIDVDLLCALIPEDRLPRRFKRGTDLSPFGEAGGAEKGVGFEPLSGGERGSNPTQKGLKSGQKGLTGDPPNVLNEDFPTHAGAGAHMRAGAPGPAHARAGEARTAFAGGDSAGLSAAAHSALVERLGEGMVASYVDRCGFRIDDGVATLSAPNRYVVQVLRDQCHFHLCQVLGVARLEFTIFGEAGA